MEYILYCIDIVRESACGPRGLMVLRDLRNVKQHETVPLLHDGAVLPESLIWKLGPELLAQIVPLLGVLMELVVKERLQL